MRPQLISEATKIIDATFVNVASGVGVKPDNVTWIELYDEGGTRIDQGNNTSKVVSSTSTQIALNGLLWDNDRPDGDWYDDREVPRDLHELVRVNPLKGGNKVAAG